MIKIDGIGYVDERSYNASSKLTKTKSSSEFDSILKKEKIIYSTPETTSETSSGQTEPVTTPEALEQYFEEAASIFNLDLNLLKAVAKQESDFDPTIVSTAGATGIMQLMPETAQSMGVTDIYDPRQNIIGGARYLSTLLEQFGGDVSLSLAAYNAGPGNVKKYDGIPPFSETQEYVKKVMNYAGMSVEIPGTIHTRNVSTDENIANTIYSVASKDTTAVPKIYTVYATPASSKS